MFKTQVRSNIYCVGERLTNEDLYNEYKEFNILPDKQDTIDTSEKIVKDIVRGLFPIELNNKIFMTIEKYLDKYFIKYFTSLSNYNSNSDNNYSSLFIGINDNPSIITGIPILKSQLPNLVNIVNNKLMMYLTAIKGFHRRKHYTKYILVNGEKYYSFDKLLSIIFRLFKVNIHILNKQKIHNFCIKSKINTIYKHTRECRQSLKKYNKIKHTKCRLNYKYSQSISQIIFNYEIMNIMSKYIKKDHPQYPFKKINTILKIHLHDKGDITKYIDDGVYINNSIISDDFGENELNKYINIFLDKFREYRTGMISKINNTYYNERPFTKKYNPMEQLSTNLLKINNFNDIFVTNPNVIQVLIEIQIPLIKDIDSLLGYFDQLSKCWKFPKRKLIYTKNRYTPVTYNYIRLHSSL